MYRRLRPDPLLIIAAVTLAGIGLCLTGLAARLLLGALALPLNRIELEETDD